MGLSKKLRFEVLKRDSFKCQYCGAEAPGVLLHVDHIHPKSKGGKNDLTNLLTSCAPCNMGKGARTLDDDTAVSKSRAQMEDLQARREQLEMMMRWREGLRDLEDEGIDRVGEYWEKLVPGWPPNDGGKAKLRKMLREFGLSEVLSAIDISVDTYLRYTDNGDVGEESAQFTFNKIGGICFNTRQRAADEQ